MAAKAKFRSYNMVEFDVVPRDDGSKKKGYRISFGPSQEMYLTGVQVALLLGQIHQYLLDKGLE